MSANRINKKRVSQKGRREKEQNKGTEIAAENEKKREMMKGRQKKQRR